MEKIKIEDIVIGQEAICPDGLGRVAKIIHGNTSWDKSIKIDTYIKNRSCEWSVYNVKIIDFKGNIREIEPIPVSGKTIDRMNRAYQEEKYEDYNSLKDWWWWA